MTARAAKHLFRLVRCVAPCSRHLPGGIGYEAGGGMTLDASVHGLEIVGRPGGAGDIAVAGNRPLVTVYTVGYGFIVAV